MRITKRQLRRIIREERRRLYEQDENKEAFQTLVDSVEKVGKAAMDAGLSKDEVKVAIQGMIDDMG